MVNRWARRYGFLFLLVMYVVGFIGLSIPSMRPAFQTLTPLTLIISLVVVIAAFQEIRTQLMLFCIALITAGFLVEWSGIQYGWIFGSYQYGDSLGPKILEVPPVIGVNWLLLTICACSVARLIPIHWLFRAFIAALLMTFLDWVLEPVAVYLDFWSWQGGHIPIQNYIAWLGLAFLFCLGYFLVTSVRNNKVAVGMYFVMLAFFTCLNLLLTWRC